MTISNGDSTGKGELGGTLWEKGNCINEREGKNGIHLSLPMS